MSGGSSSVPQAYNPASQPQADSLSFGGASQLSGLGTSLQNYAVPQYAGIYQGVQNNPYYDAAQTAAQTASTLGLGTVGPSQIASGQALTSAGNTALGQAGTLAGTGNDVLANASNLFSTGNNQANAVANSGYLNTGLGILGNSVGAADAALIQGFDPQQALYQRTLQQTIDSQNAINAMNGVASTPYGAGLADQGVSNFNIDWQNQQLAREATAASTYGNLVGTGVNSFDSLLGAGSGAYDALSSNAVSNYGNLLSGYTGALGALNSTGNSDLTAGANLGNAGLNTIQSAGALPYDTYLGQMNDQIAALNALVSGTNQTGNLTQSSVGDANSYLGLGQSATSLNQNAAQIQAQQDQGLFSSLLGALGLGNNSGGGLLGALPGNPFQIGI